MEHDLVLEGFGVRLEPLVVDHAAELAALVDDELWAGMTSPLPGTTEAMTRYVETAHATPGRLALAAVDARTGEVRGSTSFYEHEPRFARVEIGHTFFGRTWWGTDNNPACKLLMLTHAFETWGVQRVALRADARNARSVAAIQRLGGVPEGVLRSHRVAPDGSRGDTAYFSILADEWPGVCDGLRARLGVRASG